METLKREFESTEACFTVYVTGSHVRFIKEDYTECFDLVNKKCFIKIMNSDLTTKEWCRKIEKLFKVTNCYDLNDWRVA